MIRISPLALVLFLAAPAWAQEAPDKPAAKPAAKPTAVAKGEFDISETHWFRVKLNTGESMLGLARPGKLWEVQIKGSRWDPTEREAEGAGIRLWYVKRQLGFVFVPGTDVVGDPRDLGQASANDAKRIREDRERAKRKAEETRKRAIEHTKRMRERLAAKRKGAKQDGDDAAAAEKDPMEMLDGAQRSLLTKYPPDEWTPNTPDKIKHRFTILGIPAKDREKAFLAVFDKWKQAWDAHEAAKKTIAEAKKAAELAKAAAAQGTGSGDGAKPPKPGGDESGDGPKPKPEPKTGGGYKQK